ncbi:MAG: hypothetical protein ACXAC5_04185 [Promethearchaeota archaeon]|jgi:hypothetical protein
MFIIDSKFQYIFHFASTEEIAKAVRDDLASRKDCEHPELIVTEDRKDQSANWDPGGVLMTNDKTFTFTLDNITIEIYRQHFFYFVDWVQRASPREWFGVKYYKIHSGYLGCLCITYNELEQLKDQLNDPNLSLEATVSDHERQAVIEDSFDQVRRAEDKDGNPVLVKVERKKPTLN